MIPRTIGAVATAAVLSILIFSTWHPCDGAPWWVTPTVFLLPTLMAVAFAAGRLDAGTIFNNGWTATLATAFVGFRDSAQAGFIAPSGSVCEPCAACVFILVSSAGFIGLLLFLVVFSTANRLIAKR